MIPHQLGFLRYRQFRRAAAFIAALVALFVVGTPAASAHPLSNFSVNQYHGLVLHPDHITDNAVVDTAEPRNLLVRTTNVSFLRGARRFPHRQQVHLLP